MAEHQIAHIGLGNQHPLLTGQAALHAHVEKAFDFLIHPTDRLDLTPLVDGASDGQVLPQRQVGHTGQNGIEFGRGGAITINAAIGLLKTQTG